MGFQERCNRAALLKSSMLAATRKLSAMPEHAQHPFRGPTPQGRQAPGRSLGAPLHVRDLSFESPRGSSNLRSGSVLAALNPVSVPDGDSALATQQLNESVAGALAAAVDPRISPRRDPRATHPLFRPIERLLSVWQWTTRR